MSEIIRNSRNDVKPYFGGAFPKDFARSDAMSMQARALAKVQADIREKRYKATQLAEKAGHGDGWISDILNQKSAGLPYKVIEAAAELRGIDPAEYFLAPDSELRALNPLEAEFIRYARTWPRTVLGSLLTFLQYFAPASAAEEKYRQAVGYLRAMGYRERQQALAYLLLLSEGRLPEDVRARLPGDLPGGSIDALLQGVDAKEIEGVRAVAVKAAAAPRRKRGKQ